MTESKTRNQILLVLFIGVLMGVLDIAEGRAQELAMVQRNEQVQAALAAQ